MLTDDRYKQIMADLGMPNSRSLWQALQQVANEVEQATRAALAAAAQPAPAAVPAEPTEAMLVAGLNECEPLGSLIDWREGFGRKDMARTYAAMLAAAPSPAGATQAAQEPARVAPVLVRDVAEVLGVSVPEVCAALATAGGSPRSTNMEISGEELLAVAAALKPARVALPADLIEYMRKHLQRERHGLDGFTVLGNETARAERYDRWISALLAAGIPGTDGGAA